MRRLGAFLRKMLGLAALTAISYPVTLILVGAFVVAVGR